MQATNIEINAEDKNGNTALHIAVQNRSYECISLLLSNDSLLVNTINVECKTALWIASSLGDDRCVKMLIEYSHEKYEKGINEYFLDVEQADKNWRTPLLIAVLQENINVVKILIENQVPFTLKYIRTVLMFKYL